MVNHKTPRLSAALLLIAVFFALSAGTWTLSPSAVAGDRADAVPTDTPLREEANLLSDDGGILPGTDRATETQRDRATEGSTEAETAPMTDRLRPSGRSADEGGTGGTTDMTNGDSTSWVIGTIIVALLLIAVAIVIIALLPKGRGTRRGDDRPNGKKE